MSIPQNTKDAYYIYLKFDFEEEISTSSNSIINARNLDEDDNEKVILKSADVTLCQNIECNDEESFVNQNVNINFKITRNYIPEKIEEEKIPIEPIKQEEKTQ